MAEKEERKALKEEKKLIKAAKKDAKKSKKDDKDDDRVYDDDGSIFKTKAWRKAWNTICLILLLGVILIPVGLLAYIVLKYLHII